MEYSLLEKHGTYVDAIHRPPDEGEIGINVKFWRSCEETVEGMRSRMDREKIGLNEKLCSNDQYSLDTLSLFNPSYYQSQ